MAGEQGVLTAFALAGLWPGLPRAAAEQLGAAGMHRPADVTASALVALPGIGPTRAPRLAGALERQAEAYDVAALLHAAGLSLRPAARLATDIGPGAVQSLRSDPWRLLGTGELTLDDADRLAASLQHGRDHEGRGPAVIGYLLSLAARRGHTAQPALECARQAAQHGVPDPGLAIAAAADSGAVVAAAGLLALERYATAEESLAEGLARLVASAEPWANPAAAHAVGRDLDVNQLAAVTAALRNGVSLLAGGPGTGKSRTVAALVRLAEARGHRVALAAPTGRAAKRLEELCDASASTLHRLLGAQGTTGQFARDEDWPLDADLIVVDEASMLDAELAAALLSACADGAHLLLIGDPAQLPSIGAGRVLGDLLDGGRLPTTTLRTLYRHDAGGAIARLATAVRGGELPPVDDPAREVVVVVARGGEQAAYRTVQLVTDSIPRALGIAAADVQVVTPVHRGPAGTKALNAALKAQLNPGPGAHRGFDPGDRVVALANHAEAGFTNGEVGVVTGPADAGGLQVTFATGPTTMTRDAVTDLTLGFAITVHRAQGSEWPAVVVVFPPEAAGMLSRPLVYTAMTRARRHLSVVHAAGPALARSVAAVGAAPRITRLRPLLEELLAAPDPADGGAGT